MSGWCMLFQGLRPTMPKHTNPKLADLLEKCWQQDPSCRPDFCEIIDILLQITKEVSSFPFYKFIIFLSRNKGNMLYAGI